MLVVLALAAVAVIASVTVVAMGRGGELSEFAPDVPTLDLPKAGRLGAVDFMGLQIPVSLIGYHTQTVDEALNLAAGALSERDTRIAVLEQRVSELLASRLQTRHELNPGRLAPRDLGAPYEPVGEDGSTEAGQRSDGSSVLPRAGDEPEGHTEPEGSAEPERRPEREEPSGEGDLSTVEERPESEESPGVAGVSSVEDRPDSEDSPGAAGVSRSPESSGVSSVQERSESEESPGAREASRSTGTRPDAVGARSGERPGAEESR